MAYPYTLTNAVDGVTEIEAAHLNNLEAYVGIVGSSDTNSLTYKLTNSNQIDPGHKHTHAALSGTMGVDGDILHKASGAWSPKTPDAAGIVDKSTSQTIGGAKTFSVIPILPGTDPTQANEAARKGYVDTKVAKAGDTMSGNLNMNGFKVTGLAAASADGEAVRYNEWSSQTNPGHKHSGLFKPDGSAQTVYVDANGNVCVGGSSPQNELQVEKTDANARIGIIAKGTGQYSTLNLGNASVLTAGQVRYDNTNNRLEITTNNIAQRLVVDSNGNVGLKTTTFGTSASRVLAISTGTPPGSSVADQTQLFSADVNGEEGKAGLHMMNEVPSGVKLIVPGVYLKTTTGDPTQYFEGMLVVNTVDNTLKMYADGGFRQLATWS
jgi:hypothetical protein